MHLAHADGQSNSIRLPILVYLLRCFEIVSGEMIRKVGVSCAALVLCMPIKFCAHKPTQTQNPKTVCPI